jgi:hypothetical protein
MTLLFRILLFLSLTNCIKPIPNKKFEYKNTPIDIYEENEITESLKKEDKSVLLKNQMNLRFRFLPYIQPSYKNIPPTDLIDTFKIVISNDDSLLKKLTKENFHNILLIDQYHLAEIDLRYKINYIEDETLFPTIILMIEEGKFNRSITSFRGVKLKILLRFSIFSIGGTEIAYCQKAIFPHTFSNDFIENVIINKDSPFISNLADFDSNNLNPILKNKILKCRDELFTNKE